MDSITRRQVKIVRDLYIEPWKELGIFSSVKINRRGHGRQIAPLWRAVMWRSRKVCSVCSQRVEQAQRMGNSVMHPTNTYCARIQFQELCWVLTREGYANERDIHPCSTSGRKLSERDSQQWTGFWQSSKLPFLGVFRKRLDVYLSECARMNLFVERYMGPNPFPV